jgi:hypothetical protein
MRCKESPKTLILSSKTLNSLKIFLLNLSSICHGEAVTRVCARRAPVSQQSCPQLLWVKSYGDASLSYSASSYTIIVAQIQQYH